MTNGDADSERSRSSALISFCRATKTIGFPFALVFTSKPHETRFPLDIYLVRDANARVLRFVSFSETGAKSAWRCVPKHLPPSQPEPLIFCMTSVSRNTSFVIECCKVDFCNRDLKPQLHPRNKEGTVQIEPGSYKNSAGDTGLCCNFLFFFRLFISLFLTMALLSLRELCNSFTVFPFQNFL